MKRKKISPRTLLTDAEWKALEPPMRGVKALPKNARRAVENTRRMGRPKAVNPKQQVSLRLDADILAALRSSGSGWQTRVNDVLRDWVNPHA